LPQKKKKKKITQLHLMLGFLVYFKAF